MAALAVAAALAAACGRAQIGNEQAAAGAGTVPGLSPAESASAAEGAADRAGLVGDPVGDSTVEGAGPDSGGRVPAEPADGGGAAHGGPVEDDSGLAPAAAAPPAPLTGLVTTDSSLDQRRALAVKIGNGDPRDRPQAGLAEADIVYEVLVEAGRTRFIAVFHSQFPSRVGPVRSVRSSDFDILEDLSTPYLASSGANSIVLREMALAARAGVLIDIGGSGMSAPYTRDRSRRSPHNLYFHYENLGDAPESLPGGFPDSPPVPLFEYGSPNSPNPPSLPDAAGVTVTYHKPSGSVVSHVWDSVLGGWVRIQGGALHTAEAEAGIAEIAPANVAVVWMPYGTSAADRRSPQALSYGSGEALLLVAGSVHEAVWERTEGRVGFRFSDKAGNPLGLSPGSSWLLLANTSSRWPVTEATVLSVADSERLLAGARAG